MCPSRPPGNTDPWRPGCPTMTTLPNIPERHRAHRPAPVQWLGRRILDAGGWNVAGRVPDDPKLIIAGGPHTSNWDFVFAMAAILALDIRVHWLAKHSIFKPVVRPLLVGLGGIPVNRSQPGGVAEDIARRIREADEMIIAITPEGTRSRVARWKTGFLRIARATPCAVVPVTLDFDRKEIRLWPPETASEDPEEDIERVRAIFARAMPKRPENF